MCNLSQSVREQGRAEGIAKGRAEGEADGFKKGENRLATLIQKLLADGRVEDIKRATEDLKAREALMKEYALA